MITLVIYGLIAIALAASAGYAFLTFTSTSRQLTQLQENQVRLETASAALRASLLALNGNGVLFAPMGNNPTGSTYTQLPATLGVVTAAPWGQPYLYCPISQTGSSNTLSSTEATITSPRSSYSVGTYTGTSGISTFGIPYVVTSSGSVPAAGNNSGYVAFIVSTLGPGQTMPNCSQISISTSSNGTYGVTVPGGTVRAVTAGFAYNQRVVASSDRTEIYVSSSSSAIAAGNNTGQDANNPTDLGSAITLWHSLQPRTTDIFLSSGGSFSTSDDLNAEDNRAYVQGEGTNLVIGTAPGAASLASLTLSSSGETPNVNMTFQNLSTLNLNGNTLTVNQPLRIRNVGTVSNGAINTFGTKFVSNDSNYSGTFIGAVAAKIDFINYTNTTATIGLSGWYLDNTEINLFLNSGVIYTFGSTSGFGNASLNDGSKMSLGGTATVNVGNSWLAMTASTFNVTGTVSINNSGAFTGAYILDGSQIDVEGTLSMNTSGSMFLVNSSLYIPGAFQQNGSNGAILAKGGSTILAGGTFHQANAGTACIYVQPYAGNGFPIYPNSSNSQGALQSSAGGPYALPPLFAFNYTDNTIDTGAASLLTTPNGDLPYVNDNGASATPRYTVDPTTFEKAVRTLVDTEAVQGVHIDLANGCVSP